MQAKAITKKQELDDKYARISDNMCIIAYEVLIQQMLALISR